MNYRNREQESLEINLFSLCVMRMINLNTLAFPAKANFQKGCVANYILYNLNILL